MIRQVIVFVTACLLSLDVTVTRPVLHQDITTEEYWIDRGYEVISSKWCAGRTIMVQLHKDHEVITINYEEQRVSSCRGNYDGCYVDFIDEVKVLHSEE